MSIRAIRSARLNAEPARDGDGHFLRPAESKRGIPSRLGVKSRRGQGSKTSSPRTVAQGESKRKGRTSRARRGPFASTTSLPRKARSCTRRVQKLRTHVRRTSSRCGPSPFRVSPVPRSRPTDQAANLRSTLSAASVCTRPRVARGVARGTDLAARVETAFRLSLATAAFSKRSRSFALYRAALVSSSQVDGYHCPERGAW
jgi:hypothetical protein